MGEGKTVSEHQQYELVRIVPHPRTLRKAREHVKHMVITGTSSRRIGYYLHRWVAWWTMTSETWKYEELILQFLRTCWDIHAAAYATGLLARYLRQSGSLDDGLARVGVFPVDAIVDQVAA